MNYMKKYIAGITLALALVFGGGVLASPQVGAINVFDDKVCDGTSSETEVCKSVTNDKINPLVQTIVGTLIFAVGVISVIMIIVGGIRYTLSNGDSSRITSAKNTVLYAVIGLILSLLAFAIVNFVVGRFS